MEVKVLACITYSCSRVHRRKKRNCKLWVHPLLSNHSTKGLFNSFYNDLKQYKGKYFNYLSMSINII